MILILKDFIIEIFYFFVLAHKNVSFLILIDVLLSLNHNKMRSGLGLLIVHLEFTVGHRIIRGCV